MPIVSLDSNDSLPLIDQIANAVKKMVDDRAIRAGTRMPSIRNFAHDHGISRFTVVQAYDRLVAMGYLQSRQGSGFYVSQRQNPYVAMENSYEPDSVMDIVWLLRNSLEHRSSSTMPGAWWLPAAWMEETGIKKSLRTLSLKDGEFMTAYGTPSGYLPLRELLSNKLSGIGIAAGASQIVLTSGVTHAMDLIARYFIRAGDAVLVDDPGYFILFGGLKSFGAKIVGVPWNVDGPDTHAMEELIKEHRPKIFFTNTILHNPTGASISQAVAYRMLQLAEKYDMMLVEDDIYGDFHPATLTRLATLDQLNRVIYVSSFSKTVSASLRVGYFACSPELAASLCDVKLLTGLTTSEISERLMYQLLTEGHYRKHLDKLRAKLLLARQTTISRLEGLRFTLHCEPDGGMFIWAKMDDQCNSAEIASLAAKKGIMLAPGHMFKPHQEPSPWFRFNVAHCNDDATFEFLSGCLQK
ncbi:PLP-dependent aminotransferase family protein [Sideroxydans sp. CL21]|uniref:aminotransferase-like domain-containing protein n=1 Tax=Sideroxydans sp. CL21 TaxID=2600596 RepID=UPI0024BCCABC|nr:PLP-dependent aminotransferase family protein [Sideroxydans sp. CL21]